MTETLRFSGGTYCCPWTLPHGAHEVRVRHPRPGFVYPLTLVCVGHPAPAPCSGGERG